MTTGKARLPASEEFFQHASAAIGAARRAPPVQHYGDDGALAELEQDFGEHSHEHEYE